MAVLSELCIIVCVGLCVTGTSTPLLAPGVKWFLAIARNSCLGFVFKPLVPIKLSGVEVTPS